MPSHFFDLVASYNEPIEDMKRIPVSLLITACISSYRTCHA